MSNYSDNKKSVGLKGGPNEYVTHVSDLFSTEGYKADSPDVNNPYNIIQSGDITMEGVDFPVLGTDNLGNRKLMTPGNNYQFPGNEVFEVPMAQAGVELNQTSDNPFVYGDWTEKSRSVNDAGLTTIIDERSGNRDVEYSKRGVNWNRAYERWLAKGNKGSLAEFKIEAERWKKSQTQNEIDIQNRERTIQGDEASIAGGIGGQGIGNTTGPNGTTVPGGPIGGLYDDIELQSNAGVQGNTGTAPTGNTTIQRLTARPPSLIEQPEIPFASQYPAGSLSPRGLVLPNSHVNNTSTYEVNSRIKNNGKEKFKSILTDDTTVTDSDGYTNSTTKSVDNGNRERFKDVFKIYDTEDNLLTTQVDKSNILGNHVTRNRTTSEGEAAGYGLKRMGGDIPEAQLGAFLKSAAKQIPKYATKAGKYIDDAVKYVDNYISGADNVVDDVVDDVVVTPKISTISDTPKQLSRGSAEDWRFYRNTDVNDMMEPIDFVNTNTRGYVNTPTKMSWYTPSADKFSDYGGNKYSSKINPNNPYLLDRPEVWSVERIKQIMNEGYDAIIVRNGPDSSPDIRDAYEVIPLDKTIITELEKIKRMGGDIPKAQAGAFFKSLAKQVPKLADDFLRYADDGVKWIDNWLAGTTDNVVAQADDVVKQVDDGLVQVYKADGSVVTMPKADAVRLNRIEDANATNDVFKNYEDGNWFSNEISPFYLNNAKSSTGNGILDPKEAKRMFSIYLDPEDAANFKVADGSTSRAMNMSGGMGNIPMKNEYLVPPSIVNSMRSGQSGSGYNTMIGNSQEIMSNLDTFYKQLGGSLPKAQSGFFKAAAKQIPKLADDAVKFIDDGAKYVDDYFRTTPKFTSDINWSAFNKAIPENKILLQEYHLIEETTKANGTWMKNADGSIFTGTPEQFVQQQSGNFQKAFPQAIREDGAIVPLVHHSNKKFNFFDETKHVRGKYGDGVYTRPVKFYDKRVAENASEMLDPNSEKSLMQFYGDNRYDLYSNDIPELKKLEYRNEWGVFDPKSNNIKYDDTSIVLSPHSNRLKSTVNNNGLFDMTNTNIYERDGGESIPKAQAGAFFRAAAKQIPKYVDDIAKYIDDGARYVDDYFNSSVSEFTSDINWAAVNKAIPENKILLQEYNLIEETTKANGTWMKNADGSAFTGTPELFIQSKSAHFQNSYPDGITPVWRGMPEPSSSLLNDVNLSVVSEDGGLNSIKGTGAFTADKDLATGYVGFNDNSPLYQLAMKNSDNSIEIPGQKALWMDIKNPYMQSKESLIKKYKLNLEEIEKKYIRNKTWSENHIFDETSELTKDVSLKQIEAEYIEGKKTLEELNNIIKNYDDIVSDSKYIDLKNWWNDPSTRVGGAYSDELMDMFKKKGDVPKSQHSDISTDDLGIYLQQRGLDNIRMPNIIDGSEGNVFINNQVSGNYLKSLTNNNGMWDLTNPSQFERDGGEQLPQAQAGAFFRAAAKQIPKYADDIVKYIDDGAKYVDNYFNSSASKFTTEGLTAPSIVNKSTFDIGKFNITGDDVMDIAVRTRERLLTDKFIKNNMTATGRTRQEVVESIDNFTNEFNGSTIYFDDLGSNTVGNGSNKTIGAMYNPGKITVNTNKISGATREHVLGKIEHEIEHMFSDIGKKGDITYSNGTVDSSSLVASNKIQKAHPTLKANDLYENLPHEQQVRFRKAITWMEDNVGLKVGDDITDEHVEKLSFAMQNWSKEVGKDFLGKGGRTDVLSFLTDLDPHQFLKEGQVSMLKKASVNSAGFKEALKNILNQTYGAIPAAGVGTVLLNERNGGEPLPRAQEGNYEAVADPEVGRQSAPTDEEAYYNPVIRDITSGDWKQDLLYQNPWLMDVPYIGDMIKDVAKNIASQSSIPSRSGDVNLSPLTIHTEDDNQQHDNPNSRASWGEPEEVSINHNYDGSWGMTEEPSHKLLDIYFQEEADRTLAKSPHTPTSDYLEWLPSYSLKGNLNEDLNKKNYRNVSNNDQITSIVNSLLSDEGTTWEEFINNKETIFSDSGMRGGIASALLNANLGHHKQGLGWDEERQLPYMSISDAWDFSPGDYSTRWGKRENEGRGEDRSYVQSSLLHRAGNPFKIYDRFYFDPETREYISDGDLDIKKKYGGSLPKAQGGNKEVSVCNSYERLPNGTYGPSCQGSKYTESTFNPYAGYGITAGTPSDGEYTGSGRIGFGLSIDPYKSPITGHLGLNAGGRLNVKNNEAEVSPLLNATGSAGIEGEFDLGRENVKWGVGGYANQDLLNGTGLTAGLYGNLNRLSLKAGYNPQTGTEIMGGFGIPIRQKGGSSLSKAQEGNGLLRDNVDTETFTSWEMENYNKLMEQIDIIKFENQKKEDRFNTSLNLSPLLNAKGSIGADGEFDLGNNSMDWEAGVYGSKDLMEENGFTGGVYGGLNKFFGKVGYNPQTGMEATAGFKLPIRQGGGGLPPSDIPEGYEWNGESLVPIDWNEVHDEIDIPTTWRDLVVNVDGLKRGIAQAESINGLLMINKDKNSTATGLYGQRFSELEKGNLYDGTRKEFSKDIKAQNSIFDMRLNEGMSANLTPALLRDAFELTEEYKSQLGDKWDFSYEDIISLSNFLGRKGTRKYLGNVVRDGKSLETVFPKSYGANKEVTNKTPQEYLDIVREHYAGGGETHSVAAGESLGLIAKKYDTSIDELVSLNNISNPDKININQELKLPEYILTGPQPYIEEEEESDDVIIGPQPHIEEAPMHTVVQDDTLSKIARDNHTTVDELVRLNNIKDRNTIQLNQELILPEDNTRQDVEVPENAWHAVDELKTNNDRINALTDEDIIINSQLLNNPNQTYIVVDKKTGQLTVRRGEDVDLNFEVLTGENAGDAQTVTKYIDFDGDGKITDADVNSYGNKVVDWGAGNKRTGAGKYTINQTNPTSGNHYQNAPSFNLLNDAGTQVGTSIHGTPNSRLKYFDDGDIENNRQSNGCINGRCTDLEALYGLDLPEGTPLFILPEDEGNYFELIDGAASLRMSRDNRIEYEADYEDSRGDLQESQGGNRGLNSLKYKPIRSVFDEEKFKEDSFTAFDFNDTKELNNTTLPFIQALVDNKQKIMVEAQINGDVYNQIAKIAFGIYGAESGFGDTHRWTGNAVRGALKKGTDEVNKTLESFGIDYRLDARSSPDTEKKYKGFNIPFTDAGAGAQSDNNSVGYTQLRWGQVNADERKVLQAFNITSNEDLMDPTKSAIATAAILAVRYNQQLGPEAKKDIWNTLPSKWNSGAHYGDVVKSRSKYLDFEQYDIMKVGGEVENNIMYKNHILGTYEGSKMKKKGQAIFDKLNRIYYKDAKAAGMSPSNYVMSHIVS